eukprot:m.35404 g.35404  ORF g.35404 m.35404 type:complete len:392 (+) comp9889_c0_seq1:137-1312(+)
MTVEMREVLCVAVLAALLAVGHAGSFKGSVPPKPKVPNSFVAHITLYATKSPIGSGIMYYALNQSAYSVSVARMEPFTGLQLNTSMYFVEDGMFMVTNDACRPFNDSKFYNMFDWVNSPDATYAGQKQVDGRTCDEWVLDVSTAFLSQCVIGNIPVRSSVLSKTMNTGTTQIYHTFTPDSPSPAQFQVPKQCMEPAQLCPGPKNSNSTMDVYLFHPNDTTGTIDNQDVADLLGDVGFICSDVLSNHTEIDHYQYVSAYTLNLIDTWAPYQLCNNYPGVCIGKSSPVVGREASFGVKKDAGQCTDNRAIGSWLSLPKAGMCQVPEPLNVATNCTWQIVERIKTIDGKCLLEDMGLKAACLEDRKFPFPISTAIFYHAFSNEGCPNIVPKAEV